LLNKILLLVFVITILKNKGLSNRGGSNGKGVSGRGKWLVKEEYEWWSHEGWSKWWSHGGRV